MPGQWVAAVCFLERLITAPVAEFVAYPGLFAGFPQPRICTGAVQASPLPSCCVQEERDLQPTPYDRTPRERTPRWGGMGQVWGWRGMRG